MELKLIGAEKFNLNIKIDKNMDTLPNIVSEKKLNEGKEILFDLIKKEA